MLSPESRRSPDPAIPVDPGARVDSGVEVGDPDRSLTVLKGSGSSARRQQGGAVASSASYALPLAGELIDTFRLEEAIGVGGMGAVYRALDTKLDRNVALKLLPPDQAADAEVVQRFCQEGRSAAQLDHENIARVFSIGQDGPFHFIAFEYIEGVTIRQRVEAAGPLKVGEAVDIALQISNALVHASRRGVIHRDIKPSNIILTPQGRAKLVDMGLARRFERGGDHGLTQSGMTLGTFDYISPEQARDPRDVDVRSDLYSLGCTLFHMLTGRPPFPGGTVLQKLIQHQEEPPADVRSLNPDVPVELASIIAKLMAKERDRRYQGPELLVRDLLALAGSLGLERTPSDLEYWMVQGHHPWWERHLVWLLPALGFIVIIAGLTWSGREGSKPALSGRKPTNESAPEDLAELNLTVPPGAAGRPGGSEAAAPAGGASVTPAFPQTIPVSSNDDLMASLATAPPRSIIILSDAGPYRLGGRAWSSRSPSLKAGADLTIKAEAGVRPVLKFAREAGAADRRSTSLLQFVGGHVVIEGVEFELDAVPSGETVSAIRCENTELVLRGCSFRRPALASFDDREFTAVRVRASRTPASASERPPSLFAVTCHFDGGQIALRAEGPADITLKDCTLGPAATSIWYEGGRSEQSVAGELRLLHTSILAGNGPIFRFDGAQVRARVDDCVIAPPGRTPAQLVQVADPRNLSWQGRYNLYGPISSYLATTPGSAERIAITDFAAWEQTPTELRESASRVATNPVWEAPDPLLALGQEREYPTRVFLLNPRSTAASDFGARQGPFGSSLKNLRHAQRPGSARPPSSPSARAEDPAKTEAAASKPVEVAVAAVQSDDRPAGGERPAVTDDAPPAASTDPMSLPSMPPMATPGSSEPDQDTQAATEPPATPKPEATRETPPKAATTPTPAARDADSHFSGEDVVRSTEQFLSMFRGLGTRGGTLRIGSGADIELPAVVVESPAANPVEIVAEPNGVRPRIRFRPSPAPGDSPTGWIGLFGLRSGSLRLQGLDVVLTETQDAPADRLAAIAVSPGTTATVTDCTVTVSVRRPTATALVVNALPAGTDDENGTTVAAPGTVIELRNSFVRSGGDAVTLAGGVPLALKLENVMVATEGSLLRVLGGARAPERSVVPASPVGVRMDRVAARVRAGLVDLQTTPERPVMGSVDIRAENSILCTVTGDDPLFRIEGQDTLESLRDKIRWEAHKVAYHRIKTYRRDEIVQAGGLPRIYDRDDWTRAFHPTDDSPMLRDLTFRHQADASSPAWKLERNDLRTRSNSTSAPIGPDADKVPEPPADEEP